MNILDWLFVGEVVMQSAVISDRPVYVGNRRKERLLLVKRWGKYKLVLKTVETSLGIPVGVDYSVIPNPQFPEIKKELPNLVQWLEEVEQLISTG